MATTKKRRFLGVILGLGLLLLSSCTYSTFPASKAFYINDSAQALLTSTQYYIYANSKILHDVDSQYPEDKANKINGTQVVVATHMGGLDSIDTTAIYNEWGIGQNDMGILLMLYFSPNPTDPLIPNYVGMTREIGPKMSEYISMARLEQIFMDTWENSIFQTVRINDYDFKLAAFYTAILEEIYTVVYNYSSFPYSEMLDEYADIQYESYYNAIPKGTVLPLKLAWWVWVLIGVGILILILTGRFWMVLLFAIGRGGGSTGGGGKSQGYRYTR